MKKIYMLICGLSVMVLLWSCDPNKLEEIRTVPDNQIVAPTLHAMDAIVINQESYDNEDLVTFSWESADFGYSAAISYSLFISSATYQDFELASNVNGTSYSIDQQALYDKLVGAENLALPVNEVSNLEAYVTATVGSNFTIVKSSPINVSVDIAKIGLEGDLLYISGEFNSWSSSAAAIVGTEKVYAGYVDMNSKSSATTLYKFVDYVYSSNSWGDWIGGSLDALSPNGGNLSISTGMKHFNVDLNTNQASVINFTKIGLTGLGGWKTPSIEMAYDYTNKYYYVVADATTTDSFRVLFYSPEDTGWGWSYTLGPRVREDLSIGYGSDVKIFDNNISKPLLGGDANMKVNEDGTFKFIIYYTATDAAWHFKVEKP